MSKAPKIAIPRYLCRSVCSPRCSQCRWIEDVCRWSSLTRPQLECLCLWFAQVSVRVDVRRRNDYSSDFHLIFSLVEFISWSITRGGNSCCGFGKLLSVVCQRHLHWADVWHSRWLHLECLGREGQEHENHHEELHVVDHLANFLNDEHREDMHRYTQIYLSSHVAGYIWFPAWGVGAVVQQYWSTYIAAISGIKAS